MPSGRYSQMIERLMPGAAAPGDIVHVDGRVLGRHAGIIHYTIGQRRGIGIAAAEPLYVTALDAARRAGHRRPARGAGDAPHSRCATSTGSATARLEELDARGLDIAVRVRSTREPTPAQADARRRRRADRSGNRRVAGPGLRVLRFDRAAGARARRGVHPAVESPALAGRTVAMAAHPQ